MRRAAALAALLLVALAPASAYVREAGGTSTPLYNRWSAAPTYLVNDQTASPHPNIAAGSDPVRAVQLAFRAWSELGVSTVATNYGGTTPTTTAGNDGKNVISFVDSGFAYNGALAVTQYWYNTSSGAFTEADMVFNPAVSFATFGATAGVYDIQQVATHEAGHFLGLAHSAILSATMYPYSSDARQTERWLDTDDAAGIGAIYPKASFTGTTGTIAGRITRAGANVFGAHVVAVDGGGRPRAGALTLRDGTYAIGGLAPGSYTVFAEPLDGPMSQGNLGGYWQGAAFDTAFSTTYRGGNAVPSAVAVTANQTASAVDIVVTSGAASADVKYIGRRTRGSGGFSVRSVSTLVKQGDVGTWDVIVAGAGLAAPATFTILGPGVTRVGSFAYGSLGDGTPYVLGSFDFASNASDTPRIVRADSGSQVAMLTGGLEVVPYPTMLLVKRDPLDSTAVRLYWYGDKAPYTVQRSTTKTFASPVTLGTPVNLELLDKVWTDGKTYFYRLGE